MFCRRRIDEEHGITPTSADDIRERVKLLNDLFEVRDITKEEYDAKLRDLMARL